MLVHNKGNFIRHIGEVRLLPGVNELNENQAELFKLDMKNKLNAILEKNGEIEVLEPKKKTNKEDIHIVFSDLNATDAITAIDDTVDITLLEKWLLEENTSKKRATVIKAIENQIEDIKNPSGDDVVNPDE